MSSNIQIKGLSNKKDGPKKDRDHYSKSHYHSILFGDVSRIYPCIVGKYIYKTNHTKYTDINNIYYIIHALKLELLHAYL